MSSSAIEVLAQQTLADGWGRLTTTRLRLTQPDGETIEMQREVYDHGHAAAVLPYCGARGVVLLVRQFRYPPHIYGDDGWMLEVPAGLLDDDAPETAARREAEEETGFRLSRLEPAFAVYMSPGSLTEKVYCYIGAYDEADRVGPGGRLAEESEAVEIVEMNYTDALAACADGRIADAKTVMLLQHLALSGKMAPAAQR
jgi:GDP-mannose pyrophosphatase NudK